MKIITTCASVTGVTEQVWRDTTSTFENPKWDELVRPIFEHPHFDPGTVLEITIRFKGEGKRVFAPLFSIEDDMAELDRREVD